MIRVHKSFPVHAAGHADVHGRSTLKDGERVIDLCRETDDLPRGTLCLRESQVVAMVRKLGYKLVDDDLEAEMAEMRDELDRLRDIADKYATIQGALT